MFAQNGQNYSLIHDAKSIQSSLPVQVYSVQKSISGMYLEKKLDKFNLPEKIYHFNNTNLNTDLAKLFITQFESQTSNLGVSLTGTKGTGKSLLLKQTTNLALEAGYPAILVEDTFDPAELSDFLSAIPDNVVILFDEFEKYYHIESQNKLLSLLDGTNNDHNLIMLTSNNSHLLSQFLVNRPSRIRYEINYTSLDAEFTKAYLEEHLADKSILREVSGYIEDLEEVNFDLLNTVINEVNTFYPTESIEAIIQILNIQFITSDNINYSIELVDVNNKAIASKFKHPVHLKHMQEYGTSIGFAGYELEKAFPGLQEAYIEISKANVTSIRGRTVLEYNGPISLTYSRDSGKEDTTIEGKALFTYVKSAYKPF